MCYAIGLRQSSDKNGFIYEYWIVLQRNQLFFVRIVLIKREFPHINEKCDRDCCIIEYNLRNDGDAYISDAFENHDQAFKHLR